MSAASAARAAMCWSGRTSRNSSGHGGGGDSTSASRIRFDARDNRPPRARQVQPTDQARRGRAEYPVLHRGPERRVQRRRAEHHVEVGPRVGPADVPGADLLPDVAARAVASEHVARPDVIAGTIARTDRNRDTRVGEPGWLRRPARVSPAASRARLTGTRR
jgi:hypothetical protein